MHTTITRHDFDICVWLFGARAGCITDWRAIVRGGLRMLFSPISRCSLVLDGELVVTYHA